MICSDRSQGYSNYGGHIEDSLKAAGVNDIPDGNWIDDVDFCERVWNEHFDIVSDESLRVLYSVIDQDSSKAFIPYVETFGLPKSIPLKDET